MKSKDKSIARRVSNSAVAAIFLSELFGPPLSAADPKATPPQMPPNRSKPAESQCSYYRSKKEKIPVYQQPDTTSKVVAHLKLGEEVCYIGEQSGFAIVDWRDHLPAAGAQPTPAPASTPIAAADDQLESNLVFVRLVDLWTPRPGRSLSTKERDLGERVSDFFTYLKGGGVPETPVIPLGLPDGSAQPGPTAQPGGKDQDCGCGVEE